MYVNTLCRYRRGRFLRDEGEGGGGGNVNGGKPEEGTEGKPDEGKPYTPPATQEEFNRIIQDRVARAEAKYKGVDIDALKQKADAWDELSRESQSDHEKALITAREEGVQEAMSITVPNVVRMGFRVEAKGVLTDEQVESLLEDLDLVKYAKDDGEPDMAKIAKKVQAFAPAKGGQGSNGGNGRGPGFGQGSGHHQSPTRKGEAGLEEARRRFPEAFASKS